VYCYLRRKGYDNETAKDLTQGFFHEVVLHRELIQKADRSKGRFRTFLLTALDRYVIDVHNRKTTAKRHPAGRLFSLDGIDVSVDSVASSQITPEEGFNYIWVSTVLDQVLSDVREQCYDSGKETHWRVFRARLLDPVINDVAPLSLTEICMKYGIESERKASNMIITVKRRLKKSLNRCLENYSPSDSEAELEELKGVF